MTMGLDWPQEDAEVPGGNTRLWEESWDDDDTSDDFSKQLKYDTRRNRSVIGDQAADWACLREELEKVKSNK